MGRQDQVWRGPKRRIHGLWLIFEDVERCASDYTVLKRSCERSVQACVEAGATIILQAANTGLTGGSTPDGHDHERPLVLINTMALRHIHLIDGGRQVVCLPGATLNELEALLAPLGREPHSVIGSSCIGASVIGGICNNSGGALVRRGPAYTELALYAQLNGDGELRLANHLGIRLAADPEMALTKLEREDFKAEDVEHTSGRGSDYEYALHVRAIDSPSPARPKLGEASPFRTCNKNISQAWSNGTTMGRQLRSDRATKSRYALMSEVDVTGSYRKSPALLRLLLLTAAICFVSTSVRADALHDRIVSDVPSLISLYRDLHAHPELSMNEIRTSSMLATEARKAGFSVTEHVGQTGVVAVLANGPGPVLLIRADMDALPVREDTGLQFASKAVVKGPNGEDIPVAHACGHDTHMATWVETARALAGMRDQWSGTLVMILQPGEETTVGAKEMLDSGLYSRFPKPQYVMAFHDSASLPAGMIGITTGPATANVDSVDIIVHGIGGHGAVPQAAKDPIVLAARIVGTLQTLISRDLDPQEPAVVTVGSFHAGSTRNIIPDEATLLLTVRSYSDRARTILLDGIGRIARGEAIAAGVPEDRMPTIKVDRQSGTPATVNTEPLTSQMTDLFASRFGEDRVEQIRAPMIGEDFSRYGHDDPSIQSFFFWVGGVPNDKWRAAGGDITKLPSLHSAKWAPDAATVIQTASEGLASAALQILKKAH